ncbi:RNA-directed DNA polymerase from mobile element jockey isoform X2 [Helicoverpa armigera]|uniref:RNA-directed DNA polymerase from mobile element jockey isoform X2 n=1 Tax=Helicoverpa armigera TaxID=29058 RepID=UPI0030827CF4
MVQSICGLLMSRSLVLRVQGEVFEERYAWKGLPQGSVLSPLLYNLYTVDIGSCLNSDCRILQYADDLALYVTNASIVDAASSLCLSLDSLHQWLLDRGLSLSAPKSSAVIFSRKRLIPQVNISIQSQGVPVVKKTKFLGVYLDAKLSGSEHFAYLVKRCERVISILKVLSGVWWGAHPYTMKLIYNALVRSILDYGSFVLIPCNRGALAALDRLQSQCLRIISGCMKSSPVNALQVECAEPPLALRRQYLASRFLSRVVPKSSHPLIPKLQNLDSLCRSSKYWEHKEIPLILKTYRFIQNLNCPINQNRRLPLYNFSYEVLCFIPKIFYNIGISKNSPSANSAFNAVVEERWLGFQRFFTDASKLTSCSYTGAAVYYQNSRIILKFKCPKESSVFTVPSY